MRRTDSKSTDKQFFRTQERVFAMNGLWFFAAREGDVGPFKSRERAMEEVGRYAEELQHLENFQRSRQVYSGRQGELTLSIVPKEDELLIQAG